MSYTLICKNCLESNVITIKIINSEKNPLNTEVIERHSQSNNLFKPHSQARDMEDVLRSISCLYFKIEKPMFLKIVIQKLRAHD